MTGRLRAFIAAGLILIAYAFWRVSQPAPPIDLQLTQVTFDTGLSTWPAFSPDGKELVYVSDRDGVDGGLYVQKLPAGSPVRLAPGTVGLSQPVYALDGKTIAVASNKGCGAGAAACQPGAEVGAIYTIPATGGPVTLLVSGGRAPRYSPDGKSMAFAGPKGGAVMPASGGESRQLCAANAAGGAIWSPEGHALMYQCGSDIVIAPAEGGSAASSGVAARLSAAGLAPTLPDDAWWTEAGLIFSARSGAGRNLYLCPLDRHGKAKGQVVRLTNGTELVDTVSVSGGRVAFSAGRQRFDVWGVRIDPKTGKATGEFERITNSLAPNALPSLSEDGRRLLFNSSRNGFAQVWMKDLSSGAEQVAATSPVGASAGRFLRTTGRVAWQQNNDAFIEDQKIAANSRLWDVDRTEHMVLLGAGHNIDVLDLRSTRRAPILRAPAGHTLDHASYSPDDRWIVFHCDDGHILAARPNGLDEIPQSQWIQLAEGAVDKPRFAPDGKSIYFTRDVDGRRVVEGVRSQPLVGQTAYQPYPIFADRFPNLSLSNVNMQALEIDMALDRMVMILAESSANVWIAGLVLP